MARRGDDSLFWFCSAAENPPQNLVAYSNNSHSFVGQGFEKVSTEQFISAPDGIGWVAGTGGSTSKMTSSL